MHRTLTGLLSEQDELLQSALDDLRADAPYEFVKSLHVVTTGASPSELQSSGYVVHTLQTALYHGLTDGIAKAGVCTAVNVSQDMVGAITESISGTRYDANALPNSWVYYVLSTNKWSSDSKRVSLTWDID